MATAYQVSTEYLNYSHGEVIVQTTNLEEATKWYHETVESCIGDGESNFTDYVYLETIDAELDKDGEVEDVNDYSEVLLEHVFNEYTE